MLIHTLETLKFIMNNPLSRYVLRYGSNFCKECAKGRLEHALEIFEDIFHSVIQKGCKQIAHYV
jgi:hypothetical protein